MEGVVGPDPGAEDGNPPDPTGRLRSVRARRLALRAAPFVGGAIVFAVVLLVVANLPSSSRSHLKTRRPAPVESTSTSQDVAAAASSSTTDASGKGPGASSVAASPRPGASATSAPAQTTTTVSPWAGCVPAGTQTP